MGQDEVRTDRPATRLRYVQARLAESTWRTLHVMAAERGLRLEPFLQGALEAVTRGAADLSGLPAPLEAPAPSPRGRSGS